MNNVLSILADHPLAAFGVYTLLVVVACLWPFNFHQQNLARWNPAGGLHFSAPSIAYAAADLSALKKGDAFTILLKWSPDRGWNSRHRARIFAYGLDEDHQNLALEDDGVHMVLVLSSGTGHRPVEAYLPRPAKAHVPGWAAFTFNGRKIEAFSDGRKASSARAEHIKLSAWDGAYPLVFGAMGDGKRPWNGVLDSCAIYGRVCSREELKHPAKLLAESSPLVYVPFRGNEGSASAALPAQVVRLILPDQFVPLHHEILRSVELRSRDVLDIILNVAGFVPFGFLLSSYLGQRGIPFLYSVVLALLCAGALSVSLEVLQAFIPERYSSSTDVVSNMLGAIPGALLSRGLTRKKEKGT